MAQLSVEQIVEALEGLYKSVQKHKEDLTKIRVDQRPIHERWQAFMSFFIPLQIEAISCYGFTKDHSGLIDFNRQVSFAAMNSKQVAHAKKELWDFLLKAAFGITEFPILDLDEARELIREITEALMSEFFLAKVDQLKESFTKETSSMERQSRLKEIIIPLQSLVMRRYGFEGDLGYIRAQRALSDYTHDPFIQEQMELGYGLVFERAGLLPE